MIRNEHWVKDNIVLLGDAKSIAHFSIGSGTKLAMEDAIALYQAFSSGRDVASALQRFAAERREEVERPMSVGLSAIDWKEGGITGEESVAIARAFGQAGTDFIDFSTGQTVHDSEPVFGRMFQPPFADRIRTETGLATMCVGNITSADQANTILAAGRADLVAFARLHLADPSFAFDATVRYGFADIHCPPQFLAGKDQLLRARPRIG